MSHVQVKSLKVTRSVLKKINILVKKTKTNVSIIHVNINEEQTEEVVITGVKQLEKEIEGGKAICTKMVEKDIDKPSQVDENQMSLVTTMAMLRVGKEWEDIVN